MTVLLASVGRCRQAVVAALLGLATAGSGCDRPPTPAAAFDPGPQAASEAVAAALADLDTRALAARAGFDATVRIELRKTLVETDERSAQMVIGPEALGRWLEETAPDWSCAGERCRWPGGLTVTGDWNCYGDCCDLRPEGGMELETLYLRRVCLAHRERGERRLSFLVFYEAK